MFDVVVVVFKSIFFVSLLKLVYFVEEFSIFILFELREAELTLLTLFVRLFFT